MKQSCRDRNGKTSHNLNAILIQPFGIVINLALLAFMFCILMKLQQSNVREENVSENVLENCR